MRYRKYRLLEFLCVIFLIITGIMTIVLALHRGKADIGSTTAIEHPADDAASGESLSDEADTDWELILVNREHPIPSGYDVGELTTLSNGKQVSSKIYPYLQKMFDDARADGLQLFVASGYRTKEYQQELFDGKIQEYINEGSTKRQAEKQAEEWVAKPGTSEHQLGIAVDINADTSVCSSDAVYNWLDQNSWKYGFIHRYPSDKTDITGVTNEPWHYRYVGEKAASEIHSRGICLEEYLESGS